MFKIILLFALITQITGLAQDILPKWPDVNYAGDTLVGHRLDIYLPQQNAKHSRVAVIIYGSAWFADNRKKQSFELFGPALLKAGFAVVAINHRSSRKAIFPAQVHDTKAAIRFLRGNTERFSLDSSFVAVIGNSSGGHLAAFLGTSGKIKRHSVGEVTIPIEGNLGKFTNMSSSVDAVVDWYGPTNFQAMDSCGSQMNHDAADSPESTLIGGPIQENGERCALANPTTYVDATDPPFLIIHGNADPLVPPCQSEMLHQALQQQKVTSELIVVADAKHGPGLHESAYFEKMTHFLLNALDEKRNKK